MFAKSHHARQGGENSTVGEALLLIASAVASISSRLQLPSQGAGFYVANASGLHQRDDFIVPGGSVRIDDPSRDTENDHPSSSYPRVTHKRRSHFR
jgi:hypothetical protein